MGAGVRVLVVEDCADTAGSCCDLLALWGHDGVAVRDGRDALQAALAFAPDAVLLDIGLPGMNGFEVARQLRAAGMADVVLVAVTGWCRERDRLEAAAAGIDHFLAKPACPDELHRLLSSVRGRGVAGTARRRTDMFVVTLYPCDDEPAGAVGSLEFFGTPVGTADGSSLLDFDGGAGGPHAQVRVRPVGVADGDEVAAIGLALCRDELAGRAGRFDWRLCGVAEPPADPARRVSPRPRSEPVLKETS